MLSMKFASSALHSMTKDEQGEDLVSVQVTFQNELKICEKHIRHHGSDIYESQLMKPLEMVLEAAMPDELPVLKLTCCRCNTKQGVCDLTDPSLPRGFNDDHFKKGRLNRTCFGCLSYSGKRWKLSVKGQDYIRCGCCERFELAGRMKTVEEVRRLGANTLEHFGTMDRADWRKEVRTLQACAKRNKQMCESCFVDYGKLHPNGPVCECGAIVGLITKEARQKLDADMRSALACYKPRAHSKAPSKESLLDVQETLCSCCCARYTKFTAWFRKAVVAAHSKAQKRAADDADGVDEDEGRETKRRALKKSASEQDIEGEEE